MGRMRPPEIGPEKERLALTVARFPEFPQQIDCLLTHHTLERRFHCSRLEGVHFLILLTRVVTMTST
jgi:hypothetical protein